MSLRKRGEEIQQRPETGPAHWSLMRNDVNGRMAVKVLFSSTGSREKRMLTYTRTYRGLMDMDGGGQGDRYKKNTACAFENTINTFPYTHLLVTRLQPFYKISLQRWIKSTLTRTNKMLKKDSSDMKAEWSKPGSLFALCQRRTWLKRKTAIT